jgi:hypothetical protein
MVDTDGSYPQLAHVDVAHPQEDELGSRSVVVRTVP